MNKLIGNWKSGAVWGAWMFVFSLFYVHYLKGTPLTLSWLAFHAFVWTVGGAAFAFLTASKDDNDGEPA